MVMIKESTPNNIKKTAALLIVFMLCAAFVFPVVLTLFDSFMTVNEVSKFYFSGNNEQIRLIPEPLSIEQYYILLIEKSDYLALFWNSVKYSTVITFLHLLIALPTAFVFAKIRFKGRDLLFFVILVVMMMPFQVTLLPNFILAKMFGILYTDSAIILPGIFAPFGIFLMRQFIKTIPNESIEAVLLESGSVLDVMRISVIPNSKAGITAVVIMTFAETWNMVEQPLVLLNDQLKYPLSVVLNSLYGSSPDIAFAGSVIYIAPVILLYFFFKESIYDGIKNIRYG